MKDLDVCWVIIRRFCWYCGHINFLGAKIELSWVDELSLADDDDDDDDEHLQGARVTLAPR